MAQATKTGYGAHYHITNLKHNLRRFLINNKDFILVEDTSNEFWARGRKHHGQNILGKIMNRLGPTTNSEYELKMRLESKASGFL